MARLFFLFLAVVLLAQSPSVEPALAFLLLWTLGATFWRAAQLYASLYYSPRLNVYRHLPVSDGDIFRAQWHGFLLLSSWSALDFAVAYGALGFRIGAGWNAPLTGTVFGFLQWLFIIAAATLLATYGPRRWLTWIAFLLYGSAIGVVLFARSMAPSLTGVASWIPPSGWIYHAMGFGSSDGWVHDLVPCAIAAGVLCAFPLTYRRMRASYALDESAFDQAHLATATGEAAAFRLKEYGDFFAQRNEESVASIRNRDFLNRLDWQKAGFVEWLVTRTLNQREQTVAEFLIAASPQWTKSLRKFLILLAIVLLAASFFGPQLRAASGLLIFIGVFLVVFFFGSVWPGFRLAAPIGLPPPYFAFFPISFRELASIVVKVSVCRYLIISPFLVGFVWFFAGALKLGDNFSFPVGLKLVFLGLIAQPVVIVAWISPSTNDSNRFWFACLVVVYALGLLAVAFGFIVLPNAALAAVAGLLAAVLSGTALWLYAWRFNRNKFDLLPSTRSDGTPSPGQ